LISMIVLSGAAMRVADYVTRQVAGDKSQSRED
jgi:hypothetical protein